MNKNKPKWAPTCKRFVAYLDIMGFRDMVFRETHNDVLEAMERFRLPIGVIKAEAKKRLQGKPSGWDTFERTVIRPVIFSDSVLLISSDESLGAAENMIWQVKSVVAHSLSIGIPVKGAIAYGEQTANFGKSLYVGKPLIDAWELQQEVVMYGVVLHHTVERCLIGKGWIEELGGSIVRYRTPLRGGRVTHYLVDWLDLPMRNLSTTAAELTGSLPALYSGVSGSARRYVDNTIAFAAWREQHNTPQ